MDDWTIFAAGVLGGFLAHLVAMHMQSRQFRFQQQTQFNQTKIDTYVAFTRNVYSLVSWERNREDQHPGNNWQHYQQTGYEFTNAHEMIRYIGSKVVRDSADQVFSLVERLQNDQKSVTDDEILTAVEAFQAVAREELPQ